MKIKFTSLKSKLIFSYVLIILISFGFIAYYLDKNLEENSLREIKSSLINQAYLIENQLIEEKLKEEDMVYLDSVVKGSSQKIGCRLTIVDPEGNVLADSEMPIEEVLKMENHGQRPEIALALDGKIGEEIRYSSTLKMDMLYVALPIFDNNEVKGVLRMALLLSNVKRTLAVTRNAIFLSLFFALGLAFVAGSLLTRGIIKPIDRIIYISRRFSEGDFGHKIHIDSRDEIGELASTLNKMAQEIEDKIKEIEIKNQHLMAILESMVEGIIVVDKMSRIVSVNSTVVKIFGSSKNSLEGRIFLEAIRNNDIAVIIEEVLKKGEFKSCELSMSWPVQRIFQINASPVFEKREAIGCLLVIHDMSEIRRLETMRKDFVANVSHELKTPLTSIKGFIETLLEGALEDKEHSRHFLQIIQHHANRLDNLVNDLLDLSYLESKEIALEKKEINIKDLVNDILSGFKSQLKKRYVTAKNDLSPDLAIRLDTDKIGHVLTNLIDNAIKFNRENGTVKIYSQDLGSKIKIFIEDSGIGIPPKDIPRIFERFYCVDKGRSRELGGTGLGLSIAKHIALLHGGEVGVESIEGLGSKFWFTLPK